MMTEDDFAEYANGPDQVLQVNNLITWKPAGAVKLRIDSSGEGSRTPISVPGLMAKVVKEVPNHPAMKVRDVDTKQERVWTWQQYSDEVRAMAKAFIDMGLDRFDSVCILGFNAPEWSIADLAAIHAGGLAAGIYPTNGKEACKYILENSNCRILVVEDQRQLDKVWDLRGEVPSLRKIIQYSGVPSHPGVLSWKDVLATGQSLPDRELNDRLRRIAVNQACTLVYTSGTTGNPKGVMLSHDNITWTAGIVCDLHKWEHRNSRILSYLPMSHVAANMADIHAPMYARGTTYFADKNALKGTLKDNLLWCKPTQFLAVPRVWEKLMEKMQEAGRNNKGIKKTLADAAKETGLNYHLKGEDKELYGIFKKLVYSKVKKALGLEHCKNFYSGAAPIEEKTIRYFLSLDIKILELYGMSESSGPHTLQSAANNRERSVGQVMPAGKTKLVPSGDPDIGGTEIWMWGRHVMMGYLNRQDATRKDMTEDGWLKSGDLGEIDSDGFHFIVGREKDLIITAGGENIAPQPIHDEVKKELPIISNVLLLGDKEKFVSCFLTLSVEVDTETMEPTTALTLAAKDWCRSVNSKANTVQDILRGPDRAVMRGIQAGIDRANQRAVSNAQRIQKWTILPRDFSLPGGELGPTMKVKRNVVISKYEKAIRRIYDV